jgi:hypothetical protein
MAVEAAFMEAVADFREAAVQVFMAAEIRAERRTVAGA